VKKKNKEQKAASRTSKEQKQNTNGRVKNKNNKQNKKKHIGKSPREFTLYGGLHATKRGLWSQWPDQDGTRGEGESAADPSPEQSTMSQARQQQMKIARHSIP